MSRRPTSPIPVPVDKPLNLNENQDEFPELSTTHFGDGRLMKMEVDYAPDVDKALPKAEELVKVRNSNY